MGLSIENNSQARSTSPILANAITNHTAAWVYCPPFSRTPGTYPLIYPGSRCDLSNGGVNNLIRDISRSTKYRSTEFMAIRECSGFPAPEITDQLCGMESILHSGFFSEPRGSPLSK